MTDRAFSESVGYVLGTRVDVIGVFCPGCALERMRAVVPMAQEIIYVETVAKAGAHVRCAGCQRFPLTLTAQELLQPRALLELMGRVLKMAERADLVSRR